LLGDECQDPRPASCPKFLTRDSVCRHRGEEIKSVVMKHGLYALVLSHANDALNGVKKPPRGLFAQQLLEETPYDIDRQVRLRDPVLTVMEIQIGIERARGSNAATADSVQQWFTGLLLVGKPHVLPLGTDAALLLGRMNETPALRNFLVQDPATRKTKTGADLAIAAIAIAHSAVVATGNGNDFLVIDRHFHLPGLYDPFNGKWLIQPPDST
jgi:toxin FitB